MPTEEKRTPNADALQFEPYPFEEFLQEIADELSFNYMTVSFGETHKDGLVVPGIDNENEIRAKVFSDGETGFLPRLINRGHDRCRNILVIGSGASHDAYSAIPIGSDLKNQLKKELDLDSLLVSNPKFKAHFDSEALRILTLKKGIMPNIDGYTSIADHEEFDFESYLLLLTKFFREQEIRKALSEIISLRHAPSLFYEVCAHLLKNRFLDVIINFNFDELLDQAIKEEMGQGDYTEIVYDGHCKDLSELVVDGRLKIPLYIKPHGTISHKNSLRFTKDHYFDISDDIRELLKQLLSGQLISENESFKVTRINVITVGFKLESIEFNNILTNSRPLPRLFSITRNDIPGLMNQKVELYRNDTPVQNPEAQDRVRLIQTLSCQEEIQRLAVSPEWSVLDNIALLLYAKIQENFKAPYVPKKITRHKLLCTILNNPQLRESGTMEQLVDTFQSSEFFKNRTIIELAIALAVSQGKIELKELMNDRLGMMYTQYRKSHEKKYGQTPPVSLYELSDIFGLRESLSFSRNVHNFTNVEKQEFQYQEDLQKAIGLTEKDLNSDGRTKESESFARQLLFRILSGKRTPESFKKYFQTDRQQAEWNKPMLRAIVGLIADLHRQNNNHTINPRFSDPRLFIFDHFYRDQILHTDLSMYYRFNEVFECPEHWDYLLVVSDMGMFFREILDAISKNADHLSEKFKHNKIYLISCLESIKRNYGTFEDLKDIKAQHERNCLQYPISNRFIHKTLPYSEHHHHIVIFLKKIDHVPARVGKHRKDNKIFNLSEYPTIMVGSDDGHQTENYILVRSIYFYKRGFSNKINPLWVRGAFAFLKNENTPAPGNFSTHLLVKDHVMLLETFYAYHRKALSFEETDGKYLEYLLPKEMHIPPNSASTSGQYTKDPGASHGDISNRLFRLHDLFRFLRKTEPGLSGIP